MSFRINKITDHILNNETIFTVPKSPAPKFPNDYGPISSLTVSVVVKCFERLILHHIKACFPSNLDPHQFAYRSNQSTEDAIATALHTATSSSQGATSGCCS